MGPGATTEGSRRLAAWLETISPGSAMVLRAWPGGSRVLDRKEWRPRRVCGEADDGILEGGGPGDSISEMFRRI
jgi:hypothetical protein